MSEGFALEVFLEALHTASIVPLAHEPTLYAMKAFGTYSLHAPVALAIIGATLGQIFNWYVGRLLLYYEHKGKFRINPHHYERTRTLFNTYGIFLLLLSWMTLCNLLVVLAGFLNIPLKKALPLVFAGTAAHYLLLLL
jgi:membrane protein YqaA with SNARE-associated domain